MASFDATSSAVPDSLLLARQADRLARQATNTVMQDTISRPALGDSSNTPVSYTHLTLPTIGSV